MGAFNHGKDQCRIMRLPPQQWGEELSKLSQEAQDELKPFFRSEWRKLYGTEEWDGAIAIKEKAQQRKRADQFAADSKRKKR